MIYLIIKMAILLLLAGIMGFLFGWWWIRRQFVDVTEEHSRLMKSASGVADYGPQIGAIQARMRELGSAKDITTSLDGSFRKALAEKFDSLSGRIGALDRQLNSLPKPSKVDLQPLEKRLGSVDTSLTSLSRTTAGQLKRCESRLGLLEEALGKIPEPKAPDLTPVYDRISTLNSAIAGIRIPDAPDPVDLEPLQERVVALEAAVRGVNLNPLHHRMGEIEAAVRAIQIPESPEAIDLGPLHARIEAVDEAIQNIRIPEPSEGPDLAPLHARMQEMEAAVRGIHIPDPEKSIDLGPLHERMENLEVAVQNIQIPSGDGPDLSPLHGRIGEVEAAISSLRMPEPPPPVDLEPLQERMEKLEDAVRSVRSADSSIDLSPLNERIQQLEASVRGLHIPEPEAVDLTPLDRRIQGVEAAIERIEIPRPEPLDLEALYARIDRVEHAVREIHIPDGAPAVDLSPIQERVDALDTRILGFASTTAQGPDLSPLNVRMDAIEQAIERIHVPEPADSPDLSPVMTRLGEIERRLENIPETFNLGPMQEKVNELEALIRSISGSTSVDLSAVEERLESLQGHIRGIEIPEIKPADMQPVEAKLNDIRSLLLAIKFPEPPEPVDMGALFERFDQVQQTLSKASSSRTDLSGVNERLTRLETLLAQFVSAQQPRKAEAPKAKPAKLTGARPGEPLLLKKAAYGPKDDLKRISGVGKVLERLLNRLGVWYFWQVASWDAKEVDHVDRHLEVFKGRIRRDHWVKQAGQLAKKSKNRPPQNGEGAALGLPNPSKGRRSGANKRS